MRRRIEPSSAVPGNWSGTQTDPSDPIISSLEKECQKLRNEKQHLETTLSLVKITEETIKADDEQGNDLVKFYTGLPCYVVLKIVYYHVASHVKNHAHSIPLFEQFLMVLMKLRLSLCDRVMHIDLV